MFVASIDKTTAHKTKATKIKTIIQTALSRGIFHEKAKTVHLTQTTFWYGWAGIAWDADTM